MQTLAEHHAMSGVEQTHLPEPIVIPTEDPDVVLRQLMPGDAELVANRARAEKGYYWDHVTKAYKKPETALDYITQSEGNDGNRRLLLGVWANGQFAGEVSLQPHKFNDDMIKKRGYSIDVIEYWISKGYRGRGLARLAAQAASDYSLRVRGAGEVYAGVNSNNKASLKVIGAIGFIAAPPRHRDWYGLNLEQLEAAQQRQQTT
jgi:RimJ/RimL family protein N-acetyltransferase